MVKMRKKDNTKSLASKEITENAVSPSKIKASTAYGTCTERLSPFGGLLALIKFLDLIKLKEIFDEIYIQPQRKPKLGNYRMVCGVLSLLFIGFNRIWHFSYIRRDSMICGFFNVALLPVASTFWRYVDSLGINQATSLLKISGTLRERVWKLLGIGYKKVHIDMDTTVETIYGDQQGGRKGHNTKHRGKKGYRPVLAFIQETREYITGKLRKGDTISGKEAATFIVQIKESLPGCVKKVFLRGDGEFLSWEAVKAAIDAGFSFIIANKGCNPQFSSEKWYKVRKKDQAEYNSCEFKPSGWEFKCRFVAMRIPKKPKSTKKGAPKQMDLFENKKYTYRIFCTTLKSKAHEVILQYDKRADVENLVGEAKREGLAAIPSAKFLTNYAYFQLVMLGYNIWRYLKMTAQTNVDEQENWDVAHSLELQGIEDNTIRIARLKILLIAAKVVSGQNTNEIRYSIHDSRTDGLMGFLGYLDKLRSKSRPWLQKNGWLPRFSLNSV